MPRGRATSMPDLLALAASVLARHCPTVPALSGGTVGQSAENPRFLRISAVPAPTARERRAGHPEATTIAAVPPVPVGGTPAGHLGQRDAWGLTEAEKAEALARLRPETPQEREARYLRARAEVAAALAEPDAELEAERAVTAQPYTPAEPDRDDWSAVDAWLRGEPLPSPTKDQAR